MNHGYEKHFSNIVYLVTISFFIFIIFLPAVYVLTFAIGGNFLLSDQLINALYVSFFVSLSVTVINLIFGTSFAWIFVKMDKKYKNWFDNLIDLPLMIPTAALGLSVYLFWGEFWSVGKGISMIILLHVIFTLPYMVRSVSASLEQINTTYNEAASTLGASILTIFRTIDLPLFKDGVVVGSVLTFTRSLSETGATMMVASALTMTAPVYVVNLKKEGNIPEAAAASIILILSALAILAAAKYITRQKHFNFSTFYPRFEYSLTDLWKARNIMSALFLVLFIIIPTFYIILYNFVNFRPVFNMIMLEAFIVSFGLAAIVTAVGLIFAIPMAYFIARTRNEKISAFFENLHDIVLLVPTSALGFSLGLFWNKLNLSEYLVLILSHLSFTFPLLVKPLAASIKNIEYGIEESAMTLGANHKQILTTILFPLIMPAAIAGSIMAFTRSISETGATLAVSKNIKTIPVLIVDLVDQNKMFEAGFICLLLFIMSFIFLLLLKRTRSDN